MLNATWKVPAMPTNLAGSNAPGWWFGVQTADGNGALVQPILAFADGDPVYTIFNGVYDWNDQSWHQFSDTQVAPGNTIVASLWRSAGDLYTRKISCVESGWSSTDSYQIVNSQVEAVAYFVLEHQPDSCDAYPADGTMTFEKIYMEVEGKPVTPQWSAQIGQNACNSAAHVLDPAQIQFTWATSGAASASNATRSAVRAPRVPARPKGCNRFRC